ncbi:MAG: hypothetical protein LBD55_08645, partial [Treponema sp.]|nr:hypothetical protein [Treponema sp.]
MDRKKLDLFFAYLFRLVSLASVLALGAILIFVLVQGGAPFILPTAKDIRIVTERIPEINVNGTVYQDRGGFITIPPEARSVSLHFTGKGGER